MDAHTLTVEYKSLDFIRVRRYGREYISSIHATLLPPAKLWAGTIAFDYSARTIYIGSRISPAEARQVVNRIESFLAS